MYIIYVFMIISNSFNNSNQTCQTSNAATSAGRSAVTSRAEHPPAAYFGSRLPSDNPGTMAPAVAHESNRLSRAVTS